MSIGNFFFCLSDTHNVQYRMLYLAPYMKTPILGCWRLILVGSVNWHFLTSRQKTKEKKKPVQQIWSEDDVCVMPSVLR